MNGAAVREHLMTMGISRRMLADAMARDGYYIEPNNIASWSNNVPAAVIKMVERWLGNPAERPAKPRHLRAR